MCSQFLEHYDTFCIQVKFQDFLGIQILIKVMNIK